MVPGALRLTPRLVLASRSPQRREILGRLGVEFEVSAPEVEELAEGDPRELVIENARRKARAVEGELVLGADTAVVLDADVLGKPADAAEAASFLRRLSGREHVVHSGLCLRRAGGGEHTGHAATTVRFRPLADADLEWYLGTGEWRGRAGGYAIQLRGAALVEYLRGDYLNVVGLPIAELMRLAPEIVVPGLRA